MIESIKNLILRKQDKILENIKQESIDVYLSLKNEYKKGNINKNYLFQFVFKSYYRLDQAGLGDNLKIKYFELLFKKESNLSNILEELYKIKTERNLRAIHFSFSTKLLHTIDNNNPIYDSEIAYILNKKVKGKTKKQKIKSCLKIYKEIKDLYQELLKDKKIEQLIKKFKQKFSLKNNEISNIKVLDFIIWSLGKLMKKNKHRK